MEQRVDARGVLLGDRVHRVELERRLISGLGVLQLPELGQRLAETVLRFLIGAEAVDDEFVELDRVVPLARDGELNRILRILRSGLEVFGGLSLQRARSYDLAR